VARVSDLKGQMMLVSVLRTLQCAVALAVLDVACAVFLGIDLSPFAEPVMRVLLGALIVQGAVLLAWNAAAGLSALREEHEERQYRRITALLEEHMREEKAAQEFTAQVEPGTMAMRRAVLAGTYSVNGKRYAGPPPQKTVAGPVSVGCAVCGVKLNIRSYQPGMAYACAACWELL
jgi:hypothetical protein